MQALATLLVAASLAAGPTKVALMPLTAGEGVTPSIASALSDSVAAEVRKVPGLQVITQQEISAVLGLERQKALLGCQNDACLTEIGGALGVDRLIIGSVARLGQSFVIHLQLVDAHKSTTIGQSDRRQRGGSIDDVLDAIPAMVTELFGAARATLPAEKPVAQAQPTPPASPAGPAAKVPAPYADVPLDLGSQLPGYKVAGDGQGHFLAFVPFMRNSEPLLFGDERALYAQLVVGRSAMGDEMWSATFWEPRVKSPSEAQVIFKDGKYTLWCGKKEIAFKPLSDADSQKVLKRAKLFENYWRRQAFALARDDDGTYFFVDSPRSDEVTNDLHLYVGRKGKLVPQQVTSVDHDDDATFVETAQGRLKLPHYPENAEKIPPAEWIAGGNKRQLKQLDLWSNKRSIYSDLGAYSGDRLGTPCDGQL